MVGVTTISEPVDARILLAIAVWHDHDPSESVTAFCTKHDISRSTFYTLRARARNEGQAAVLLIMPAEAPKDQAVAMHKTLEPSR